MSVIIKDIQRNSSEIIRIEVSEFKGRELINVRIWYQTIDSRSGDVVYKPTQKGVTLNLTEFTHAFFRCSNTTRKIKCLS